MISICIYRHMRTYIIYFISVYRVPYYLIFVLRKDLGWFVCQKLQKIAGQLAGLVAWGLFLGKPASFHSVSHQIDVRFGQSSQREKSTNKHVFHGVNEAMKGPCVSEMSTFIPEKALGNKRHKLFIFGGCKNPVPKTYQQKVVNFFGTYLPNTYLLRLKKKNISTRCRKTKLSNWMVGWHFGAGPTGRGESWCRQKKYELSVKLMIGNHCFFHFRKYMRQCVGCFFTLGFFQNALFWDILR